jgi:hypothetical protein
MARRVLVLVALVAYEEEKMGAQSDLFLIAMKYDVLCSVGTAFSSQLDVI